MPARSGSIPWDLGSGALDPAYFRHNSAFLCAHSRVSPMATGAEHRGAGTRAGDRRSNRHPATLRPLLRYRSGPTASLASHWTLRVFLRLSAERHGSRALAWALRCLMECVWHGRLSCLPAAMELGFSQVGAAKGG